MPSRVTKNKKHSSKQVSPITYTLVFSAATIKVLWVVSFQAKSKKTFLEVRRLNKYCL